MPKLRKINVDDLWALQRLGNPSLCPDGAQAVCTLATPSMADNKSRVALWLLSTLGGEPRQLTQCGERDGQPAFSPKGDLIGFIAKREQGGSKDETPQFYVIPPDGGEARRVGQVATGVESFKWFPDGRHIAFASWVWPELKGAKAQAARHKAWTERKESGYATSQAQYRHWDHNLPQDRVVHLHRMDVATGEVTDLFEGTPYEISRREPDAGTFDIAPDGSRIVFGFDPGVEKGTLHRDVLVELSLPGGRSRSRPQFQTVLANAEWTFEAPAYSPDGGRIACLASHQGRSHTMPEQLAIWHRTGKRWEVASAQWDHAVAAPLQWEEDGEALLFGAEQKGRKHLWRFDLADQRAEIVVAGGTLQGFDKRAGTLVTVADSADHPAQTWAHLPGEAPRRMERFNDALMAQLDLGTHEEVWFKGAQGDRVQMWLFYPPGFDPKKRYPVMHAIHGGPHTAPGDNWHYRWNNRLFAAQGRVVASVNYHGSSSFGHAFLDAITQRWGELELQDIEAATTWLLRKPWVDKRRITATGGSYGGFMVAWMNAHVKPGRYAAYICHAGCFDWTGMFADDAWSWHAKELGAWYWDDMAKVHAQSPHAHAKGMRTPTLVIHGQLDYRVPDAQGLAYYNTLKARGVDARLLWFPDENHWILKPRNSALWHQEFFAWLDRHETAAVKGL